MLTVARLLNKAGYRTRNGSKFSNTTVERLLTDPAAKGWRRANYTRLSSDGKKLELKPKEDWVYIPVEPIVSEDIWNQCNAIIEERHKNGKKRPAKKPVHLFTGLVSCYCGNKMYVPSNNPKYICLKCHNKIPVRDLEAIFHEQLKGFVFSPEKVANYLEGTDKNIKEKEELLTTLEKERDKTQKEMDKIYQLYLDDEIPKQGFGKKYKPLEERLEQIANQIPEIQGKIDFLKINIQSSDKILNDARDLFSRWPTLSGEEKRKIVETITEQITVADREVSINLCYLPSAAEIMADSAHNLGGS